MKFKFRDMVRDEITGFAGVVTASANYITGCQQFFVQPGVKDDKTWQDGKWFDENRLVKIGDVESLVAASNDESPRRGGPQADAPTAR